MSLCVQLVKAWQNGAARGFVGARASWQPASASRRTVQDWEAGVKLSDQPLVPPPGAERSLALLQLLRDRRCLLVLDNLDTLFEPSHHDGRYRQGMGPYGRLLQAVGEAAHQSCLVLTSREAPSEPGGLSGGAVRSFQLGGMEVDEARVLLAPKTTGWHLRAVG